MSTRLQGAGPLPPFGAEDDPLHEVINGQITWTTVNFAEAIPGVPTPLGWTFWQAGMEAGGRGVFADMGILPRRLVRLDDPPPHMRFAAIFYGHVAGNVDLLRDAASRAPGFDPDAFERQYFGSARPEVATRRSLRRYPFVVAKLPAAAVSLPRRLARVRAGTEQWWRSSLGQVADPTSARALLVEAVDRFERVLRIHGFATMLAQGVYELVGKVAASAGVEGLETRLATGYEELEETQLAHDLWAVSRNRVSLDEFLGRHGYHGPSEGELSSRSWREDPTPLQHVVDTCRGAGDEDSPASMRSRQSLERETARSALFAAVGGRVSRARARVALGLADRHVPLREVGKAAFLQVVDVGRAAARSIGHDLVRHDVLDDPEDAFFLTLSEILAPASGGARELVEHRRQRREQYLEIELPDMWVGQPQPLTRSAGPTGGDSLTVTGVAASPGVAEGRVRVITDPGLVEPIEQGEVLVATTTDPSWVSMFLSAGALVIDVGGALSHGAIVARELGIPCVINTRDGTRRLHTGDTVRVDGEQGVVEILARAGGAA